MNKFREADSTVSECSPVPTEEPLQTFGGALEHLKNGKRVARKEWASGDEVFVYLEKGSAYFSKRDNGKPLHGVSTRLFDKAPSGAGLRLPSLSIVVRGNVHPGYVPPQFDMLAEDWFIVC